MATPALVRLEEQLNDLRPPLKAAIDSVEPTREADIRAAAGALYAKLVEACDAGFLVVATKGSGRDLKIGAVGPLGGTSFAYALTRRPLDSMVDDCELVVIVEFRVRHAP